MLVIGTDTSPTVVSSLTSGRTRRLRWLASMIVGVKARLTPKLLNSTVIVGTPPVVADGAGDRHRKLAAGEKARGLAGHRRQVRLGQARDEPLLREGVDRGDDGLSR